MGRFLPLIAAAAVFSAAASVTHAAAAEKHTAFFDGQVYSGEATYYEYWKDGYGSCGLDRSMKDPFYVAALANKFMREPASITNPNNRYLCQPHYCVRVTGPKGSIVVKVSDTCEGCKDNDIDLADSVYPYVAEKDAGRVKVTWSFVDCNQYPPGKYDSAAFDQTPANSGAAAGAGAATGAAAGAAAGVGAGVGAATGAAAGAATGAAADGASVGESKTPSGAAPAAAAAGIGAGLGAGLGGAAGSATGATPSTNDTSAPYTPHKHKILDKGDALVNGMLGAAAGMLGLGPAYNLAKTIVPHLVPEGIKKRVQHDRDIVENLLETGDIKKFGPEMFSELKRINNKFKGDFSKLKEKLHFPHKNKLPLAAGAAGTAGALMPQSATGKAAPASAEALAKGAAPAIPASGASAASPAAAALGASAPGSASKASAVPGAFSAKRPTSNSASSADSFSVPADADTDMPTAPSMPSAPGMPSPVRIPGASVPRPKVPSLNRSQEDLAQTKAQLKQTYGKIKDLLLPKLQIYRDLLQKKIEKTRESLNEIRGLLSSDGQALIDKLNGNLDNLRNNLNNFAVKIPVVNTPTGPQIGGMPSDASSALLGAAAPAANGVVGASANTPPPPNASGASGSGFDQLSNLVNSQIDAIIRELNDVKKTNFSLLGSVYGVGRDSSLNQIQADKNAAVSLGKNAFAARSDAAASKIASPLRAAASKLASAVAKSASESEFPSTAAAAA